MGRGLSGGGRDAPRARHRLQRPAHPQEHLRLLQLRLPLGPRLRRPNALRLGAARRARGFLGIVLSGPAPRPAPPRPPAPRAPPPPPPRWATAAGSRPIPGAGPRAAKRA